MGISSHHDEANDCLHTIATGLITFEALIEHLDEEAARGHLHLRELFDASQATADLTAPQLRAVVDRLLAMSRGGPLGRTAVVANNDFLFGVTRTIGILTDLEHGPEIRAFRSRQEAVEWLGTCL